MAWQQRDGNLKGPKGDQGAQGPQGPQGMTGPQGQRGLQGIQGAPGSTGDTGPRGLQGVQGIKGDPGEAGRTVLSTTGKPGNAVGFNGDFAYDAAASVMYGPKASNAWPNGRSLQGEMGPQGPRGEVGAAGAGSNMPAFPTLPAQPVAGRYYTYPPVFTGNATTALALGLIYFMPVLVYRTPTPAFTACTVEVTTANTNAYWKLGMYAMDDGFMPTYCVNDFGGMAATAAPNGRKIFPVSQVQNDNLTPGPYYVALYVQGSAGGSIRTVSGASNAVPYLTPPSTAAWGALASANNPTASGSAFPDYPVLTGNAPAIRFDFTTG